MSVTHHCDSCKRVIDNADEKLTLGMGRNYGYGAHVELCQGCAGRVVSFLVEVMEVRGVPGPDGWYKDGGGPWDAFSGSM